MKPREQPNTECTCGIYESRHGYCYRLERDDCPVHGDPPVEHEQLEMELDNPHLWGVDRQGRIPY